MQDRRRHPVQAVDILHQRQQLVQRESSLFRRPHQLLQRLALQIAHDQIARAVFLEGVIDIHDMRKVLHLDKQLALGQKLLLPALIGQLLIRKGADLLCTLSSVGPAGWKILLDRDDAPQVLIPRQIGHAEAARAKTYADHIMRVKDRTDREIRAVARRLHVLLTVRAP